MAEERGERGRCLFDRHLIILFGVASRALVRVDWEYNGTMPAGPFASSVGVGRAEPEWAALNKVTGVCGNGKDAHTKKSRDVAGLFFCKSSAPNVSGGVRAQWRLTKRAALANMHPRTVLSTHSLQIAPDPEHQSASLPADLSTSDTHVEPNPRPKFFSPHFYTPSVLA